MELLMTPLFGQALWLWLVFGFIVVSLLAFDLGVLHKDQHEISVAESLWLSAGYFAVAMLFGLGVWWQMGAESAIAYYTAFLVEKSLSLDNVFVISLIFGFFAIPRLYQHRVLFWGIMGVLILRAIMIGLGAAIISNFSWVLYLFGAFLVVTGIKMLVLSNHQPDLENNALLRFLRHHLRITPQLHEQKFMVRLPVADGGPPMLHATPLLLALVMIESADLVFAVDSVPAVFSITQEPFLVYTSNIFAILGLRALYFALAAMVNRFVYLKYALALVLVFIGIKIFLAGILGKFPASISLTVTVGLILGGVLISLWKTRNTTGH